MSMNVLQSAPRVLVVMALAACGPRGGAGKSDSQTIESVSIYSWGDDPYHGRFSSTVHLGDTGCYEVESESPQLGPSSMRSCMPSDRARALLAEVRKLWAEGGWIETSFSGASETLEQVTYATTSDKKTWRAPAELPNDALSRLVGEIRSAVIDHYRTSTPSPDDEGPLGFAMVSFIVVDKGRAYQADLDTRGRWQCAVPRDFGREYSFGDDTEVAAGRVAPAVAAALLDDVFAGVSFEPAEARSINGTRVELRSYPGDTGRELLPDAVAVIIERWRERAAEFAAGCAVP